MGLPCPLEPNENDDETDAVPAKEVRKELEEAEEEDMLMELPGKLAMEVAEAAIGRVLETGRDVADEPPPWGWARGLIP